MAPTIREILDRGPWSVQESSLLKRALSEPWCWPRDGSLASKARALGYEPPAAPEPGQTCLLSVSGPRAALWKLDITRGEKARRLGRSFGVEATEAIERGWLVAARDLPVLTTFDPLSGRGQWVAFPLGKVGDGQEERVLDGASYGLAICLASASVLIGEPLPADVAALGTLGHDGAVGEVGGLEDKLRALAAVGLGVRRILVAREQRGEAEALVEALSADLEVRPVGRLSDAVEAVFPDLVDRVVRRLAEPSRAREALDSLFRQALGNHTVLLGWRGVARAAEAVRQTLAGDADAVTRAELVRRIARRHEGEPEPSPWPPDRWLAGQPRPVRLAIVAHLVQGAADAADPDIRKIVERGLAHVARRPEERHAGDLEVLGAAGRALAGVRDDDRADALLAEAVEGWQRILRADECSYALCERLRLLGMRGDAKALRTVVQTDVARFEAEPGGSPISRCFVALAVGRAYVQAGEAAEGLAKLDGDEAFWGYAPRHARCARLRWRARAFDDLEQPDDARRDREKLERIGAEEEGRDANVFLARLDAAFAAGTDPVPHLRDMESSSDRLRDDLRRLLGSAPRDSTACRRVADEWRY